MKPIVFIFSMVLIASVMAVWTIPVTPFGINHLGLIQIRSVYTDLATDISHVLISDYEYRWTFYLAIADDGKLIRSHKFTTAVDVGVVTGADDGKHIYISLWVALTYFKTVTNFTESLDGGATWSTPITVSTSGIDDMLLIKETGRIFIFLHNDTGMGDVRMVSRAPGSTIFSKESIIVNAGIYHPYMKAGYNFYQGKQTIHLFFTDGELEMLNYSQSLTNGETWTKPVTVIKHRPYLNHLVSEPKLSEKVFVSYNDFAEFLMSTSDNGKTFSKPLNFSYGYGIQYGLAICGTKENAVMASYPITKYSHFNITTMKETPISHPFPTENIISTGLGCPASKNYMLKVNAFAIEQKGKDFNSLLCTGDNFLLNSTNILILNSLSMIEFLRIFMLLFA